MDELTIKSRIRWFSSNNEFFGTCYKHKDEITDYAFDSWFNLREMQTALENRVRVRKEGLVISMSKISGEVLNTEPVLTIPICSKQNGGLLELIIKCILNEFNGYPNSILYCIIS